MQAKSIRDDLRQYLHRGWYTNRMRNADLNRLIEALEKKEAELEEAFIYLMATAADNFANGAKP